jgi:diguanylate cyclase
VRPTITLSAGPADGGGPGEGGAVSARSRALVAVALASPLLLWLLGVSAPDVAFPAAMGVHGLSVLAAAAAMLVAAGSGDPALRRARLWFAAALLISASGFAIAAVHAALIGEAPLVSPANLTIPGWLGCALAGLFAVPSSPYREGGRWRALCDGVVVAAATSLVFWIAFLRPVWGTGDRTGLERLVLLSYPVVDLVLAAAALGVLAHVRADQRRFLQVATCGLLLVVVADAASATRVDAAVGFQWHNVLLQAGLAVLLVAALLPAQPHLRSGRAVAVLDAVLPQLPVLVAVPVGAVHGISRDGDATAALLTGVMVLALLGRSLLYATHLSTVAQRLQEDATQDALTGLVNRRTCLATLGDLLAERAAGEVAVVLLDLDGFKEVNDGFGHAAGDRALQAVGDRLARCDDAVVQARLGGDEFALLVAGEDAERAAVLAAHELTGERWVDVGEATVQVGASAGIAVSQDGDTTSSLLRRADLALYEAKRSRQMQVAVFTDDMAARAERRHLLTAALRGAAARGEVELVYQPLVRLSDGVVVGAEALLRWGSPLHGLVLPTEFVPLAEETGVVGELGLWVLDRAASDLRAWEDAGRALPQVFVNVSAHQLHEEFPDQAVRAVRAHGVDPARVVLEVTESALPDGRALEVVARLRDAGFRTAMDDFGAGFSSLAQLAVLPVDTLKFDRAFLLGAATAEGRRIVDALIGLAAQLGLTTVAEGVESPAEAAVVRRAGCQLAQGYHFSRPVTARELWRLLAAPLVPVVPVPPQRGPGVRLP